MIDNASVVFHSGAVVNLTSLNDDATKVELFTETSDDNMTLVVVVLLHHQHQIASHI